MNLTPHEVLQRGRSLAASANDLRLKNHVGDLLVFGCVAEAELFTARAINVSAPVGSCDLGLVLLRHSRPRDGLAMSLSGWAIVRVGHGSRVVGPLPGDINLARARLRLLGLDPTRPLYEQSA